MDYEKFKEYHERRPFAPFDIRTSDGRVYTVDHREFLKQSRNRKTIVYTTEDDRDVTIDANQITALEVANTHAA
jgi:hypothetical protein